MMMKQSYTKENDMDTEIDTKADEAALRVCALIDRIQTVLVGKNMTEGITALASVLIGGMRGLDMSKDAILAALSEVIDVEMEAENE
jgi:hypothetical protein